MRPSGWDARVVHEWQRIAQDIGISVVGCFLFIYGALAVRDTTILTILFAGGGALLGLPHTRRLDRKSQNGDEGIAERWSHLP